MHQAIKVTGLAAIATTAIIAGSGNVDAGPSRAVPAEVADDVAPPPLAQTVCEHGYWYCPDPNGLDWTYASSSSCLGTCGETMVRLEAWSACNADCSLACRDVDLGSC